MNDIIWVGNTLLPRDAVFLAAGVVALALIGAFVWLTGRRP